MMLMNAICQVTKLRYDTIRYDTVRGVAWRGVAWRGVACDRIVANALLVKVGKDVNGSALDCLIKHVLEFRKVLTTLDNIACV
jgi:hypothetical protein